MKKFEIDGYRQPLTQRIAYTPDEAAQQIGFSRNGLYPYLISGQLRSFKVGPKKRLILRSDLLAFLESLAASQMVMPPPGSTAEADGGAE